MSPRFSAVKLQHHLSAIASGFLGDRLEAEGNPLALPMQVLHLGHELDPASPVLAHPAPGLCLSIHGLMELESIWEFPGQPGENYGSRLSRATGEMTPLMLRYNTGRPIHRNGQALAALLEDLVANWPVPVRRIVLLGHSMGGLLIRSACHYGEKAGYHWMKRELDCVYIGSPHDGSWLARGAKATARLLNQAPRDYLKVAGEIIDLRSDGIRNLSRGEILPPEEKGNGLPANARHYVVCGLLARGEGHPVNELFGDALVHESSAKGRRQQHWRLSGEATFPGIGHVRLTHHPAVARQLEEWLL